MCEARKIIVCLAAMLSFIAAPALRAQDAEETGVVWAVVVGVSRVGGANPTLEILRYADDDAVLFYRLLQDPLGARAARDRVFLHLSSDESDEVQSEEDLARCNKQQLKIGSDTVTAYPATRNCILASLRTIAAQARPGDRVIVFFSGHGLVSYRLEEENDETLFLATADLGVLSDLTGYKVAPDTGLKVSEIIDAFADWYKGKKIPRESPRFLDVWILLDTCHAGAAASEKQLQLLARLDERLRSGEEPGRGVIRVSRNQDANTNAPQEVDTNPSPELVTPKMRFMFVSSSSAFQSSWEDSKRKQGVFTYYLARAIRGAAWEASPYRNLSRPDDQLISADLGAYLRLNVNQHTMNLIGEGQLPTALPEFDTIPGFSFTRTERRFGISVDAKTPDNARVTVQLRSPDGRRVLTAEAPYLFTLAQIDAQLGAGDTYLLEIRAPRQRVIQLEVPLSLRAPTSVVVEYPFRGAASISVKVGDEKLTVEPVPNRNLFRAIPTTKQ